MFFVVFSAFGGCLVFGFGLFQRFGDPKHTQSEADPIRHPESTHRTSRFVRLGEDSNRSSSSMIVVNV